MAEKLSNPAFPPSVQQTRLAGAVLAELKQGRRAIVTTYTLFQVLRLILATGDKQKLFIRSNVSPVDYLHRIRTNLIDSRSLKPDPDYKRNVYRVLAMGDSTAEEVCALANPLGYISHLSAMQRWGLTERRPQALHLSMPPASIAAPLIQDLMMADYGKPFSDVPEEERVKLQFIQHPAIVRGRKISIFHTKHLGHWIQIQGEHARLATIGQTFLDMLEAPALCGGIAHVIDIWRKHALTYTDDIIDTVDELGAPIHKVRAGYIFDEVLKTRGDPRINSWIRFAQRGGSRVLDPSKPFSPHHSGKWMLSINV